MIHSKGLTVEVCGEQHGKYLEIVKNEEIILFALRQADLPKDEAGLPVAECSMAPFALEFRPSGSTCETESHQSEQGM